jgi:hypothetical protein
VGAQKISPYQGMEFIPTIEHKLTRVSHIKHAVKKFVGQELDPSKSFASQRVGAIRVIQNLVSYSIVDFSTC